MITSRSTIVLSNLILVSCVFAQTNYDETKIPKYTLPNPLVMNDGSKVTSVEQWRSRRAEIFAMFETHMFGKIRQRPNFMHIKVTDTDKKALGGKATRKQVSIFFAKDKQRPRIDILIYIPNSRKGPVPTFVGNNFSGNHATIHDKKVAVTDQWMRKAKDNKATESGRGKASGRWPFEKIIARGYACATVYCGDLEPDHKEGWKDGVRGFYLEKGKTKPGPVDWSCIGAWAWGMHRVMDYFETDDDIDHKRVAIMGHSRLGKTSLWGGASDERFALVISNNSGCGGAALSRRAFGETVKRINTSFPHWFCDNYKKFNDNEGAAPFDQHMLIALMAPRPVYVASAEKDRWADPHGEFLSAKGADPVYRLLGTEGLPAKKMPKIDKPVHGRIGYHIRTGKHDVTEYDWTNYMDFADKHFKR